MDLLRKTVFLITCALTFSCSSTQPIPQNVTSNDFGAYGIWMGTISQFTTKQLQDSSDEEYTLAIVNCGVQPAIYIVHEDRQPLSIYGDYKINSKSGSYVMHKIIDGDGWVETQIWSFVLMESGQATVQWNRLVSNRSLGDSERLRSFGQIGYGELYQVSDECSDFE